jgi:hypothetical protein
MDNNMRRCENRQLYRMGLQSIESFLKNHKNRRVQMEDQKDDGTPKRHKTTCPTCSKEAYDLAIEDHEGSFVVWCEEGHVNVFDNNPEKGLMLVYKF